MGVVAILVKSARGELLIITSSGSVQEPAVREKWQSVSTRMRMAKQEKDVQATETKKVEEPQVFVDVPKERLDKIELEYKNDIK